MQRFDRTRKRRRSLQILQVLDPYPIRGVSNKRFVHGGAQIALRGLCDSSGAPAAYRFRPGGSHFLQLPTHRGAIEPERRLIRTTVSRRGSF